MSHHIFIFFMIWRHKICYISVLLIFNAAKMPVLWNDRLGLGESQISTPSISSLLFVVKSWKTKNNYRQLSGIFQLFAISKKNAER